MSLLLTQLLVHLLVLPLATAPCPGQSKGLCPLSCRCQQQLLDCSHAALASVPQATHCSAYSVLDFTNNSISFIKNQAWMNYSWAEDLILQDNDLQAVKRDFLQGLLLLKHLDLSSNKIMSIEERAFEPLPFLQLLNLSGNRITQIRNSTFQAWHGMQFLQKLILSHNPLSVIADASFFNLPSIKYLDLGTTQVTPQTVLTLLLTTLSLETLKLPNDTACCLCQEKNTTETPCRTVVFHCENLCTTNAPHCAREDTLAETRGQIMEGVQPRKLKASRVLNLEPMESFLGHSETITLVVVLSLTGTDGNLSNPSDHISTTNSYSSQLLSRQESETIKELMLMLPSIQHRGWTSENDMRKLYFLARTLVAELKKKLHQAEIFETMKNPVSPLLMPATQKHEAHDVPAVEGETTTGWVQEQRDLGLNQAASKPWEAAGTLNPTASSTLQDMAEEEGSSLGKHLPDVLRTAETHWKQQKQGSSFLNKPGSSASPNDEPVPGDLFETKVSNHLQLLIADKSLQRFIVHVAQVLRMHCSTPKLQPTCAKMVSKTGMLIKLLMKMLIKLSKRQDDQGASALTGQCLWEGDISIGIAQDEEAGGKSAGKGKPEQNFGDEILLAIAVSVIIMIGITVVFLIKACFQKPAATSQCQSTSKSHPRRFFQKLLPQGCSKNKDGVREQCSHGSHQSQTTPQWLIELCKPLDSDFEMRIAELYDGEQSEDEDSFYDNELKLILAAPQESYDCGERELPRNPMPVTTL